MKTNDNERVWAFIEPANWKLFVNDRDEIGVFEGLPKNDVGFMHGLVYLTIGKKLESVTTWTDVSEVTTGSTGNRSIDFIIRPTSFQVFESINI